MIHIVRKDGGSGSADPDPITSTSDTCDATHPHCTSPQGEPKRHRLCSRSPSPRAGRRGPRLSSGRSPVPFPSPAAWSYIKVIKHAATNTLQSPVPGRKSCTVTSTPRRMPLFLAPISNSLATFRLTPLIAWNGVVIIKLRITCCSWTPISLYE